MICDDISDKSTDTGKTGLELHEDNQTTLSSCSSKFDNQYQVLAIVGDNSEEFDDNNNPVLNPANITRGVNHLAEGDTAASKQRKNSIISRRVEHNQSNRRARLSYTDRCKPKCTLRVSLCPTKAVKITGKRKK
jgi:hypothetical protein